MKAPFFITGLFRTRTSWLANLFTTGEQHCYHDLMDHCASLSEFQAKLAGGKGDSDSSLVFLFPQLVTVFPQSRWLLVLREPAECLASLQKAAQGTNWQDYHAEVAEHWAVLLAQYQAAIQLMKWDKRVYVLDYEQLESYTAVASAVEFLTPGALLSRERFDLLDSLLVQPIPAKCHRMGTAALITETLNLIAN
jgi:phytoene dehydrogenase-like protein